MTRAGILGAPGAHLDEGALVRRLDGELEPGEAGDVEAHLAACARCRAELDNLAALAARVSAALPLLDAAPAGLSIPRRRPRSAWPGPAVWRAAAALAFVAGLALAIAPVRAWIAERLGLAPEGTTAGSTPPADAPAIAPEAAGGVRVTFLPTGERFRILLSAPQVEGALHLEVTAGDTASGEVVGTDDIELLVLPDGLGIRNHAFSDSDYRIVVPRDMAEVELRVAGRVRWQGAPGAVPPDGIRIDLTEGLESDP